MAIEIDPDFKIDTRRPRYEEPKTAVSKLVQMPAYLINGYSLSNAVMKDWRTSKGAKAAE